VARRRVQGFIAHPGQAWPGSPERLCSVAWSETRRGVSLHGSRSQRLRRVPASRPARVVIATEGWPDSCADVWQAYRVGRRHGQPGAATRPIPTRSARMSGQCSAAPPNPLSRRGQRAANRRPRFTSQPCSLLEHRACVSRPDSCSVPRLWRHIVDADLDGAPGALLASSDGQRQTVHLPPESRVPPVVVRVFGA